MRVIGVDLAWAEHNRSGLCAVEDGHVIDSDTAGDNDAVAAWIEDHSAGDEVLVAFDAPLIVENAKGCRGCELVIAAAWGAAHASCHSANRSRPWFADGGRAHHLARRLRLSTDPAAIRSRPIRVALEVYPHTALVSLFNLDVILKYKAKRRRTVQDRHGEFRRFVQFLLDLRHRTPSLDVTRSAAWPGLLARVDAATTGAALDRVEDELDAYVCAYIGLHYEQRRGCPDSLVIGDAATGYVVTPVDEPRRAFVETAAAKYGVAIA